MFLMEIPAFTSSGTSSWADGSQSLSSSTTFTAAFFWCCIQYDGRHRKYSCLGIPYFPGFTSLMYLRERERERERERWGGRGWESCHSGKLHDAVSSHALTNLPCYEHVDNGVYNQHSNDPGNVKCIINSQRVCYIAPLESFLSLLQPRDNLHCQSHARIGQDTWTNFRSSEKESRPIDRIRGGSLELYKLTVIMCQTESAEREKVQSWWPRTESLQSVQDGRSWTKHWNDKYSGWQA